jgi:hypothetical protein
MRHKRLMRATVDHFRESVERRNVGATVREVTVTPTCWYDGLDPATAWCLVWIAPPSPPHALITALGVASRFGYRHARLILGSDAHPAFSVPDRVDDEAEALFDAAARLASSRELSRLPDAIAEVHERISSYTAEVVHGCTGLPRQDLVRTFDLMLDFGLAIGVAEHEAVHAATKGPATPARDHLP